MFLKEIRLKNFQSHKDSILKFDRGFNCIVGDNNVGKSAIIRALSLIFEGKFDKNWITKGEEKTLIEVKFDNLEIIREKGDKVNKAVIRGGNKEEVLENFGSKIPSENIKFKKLLPLRIRNRDIIFYDKQFEDFFVFETPSSRAEILRAIFGFDKVDEKIKKIRSKKDELNNKIKENEIKLTKNLEVLKKLEELRLKLKEKYEEFNKIYNDYQNNQEKLEKLKLIKDKKIKGENINKLLIKKKVLIVNLKEFLNLKEKLVQIFKIKDKITQVEKINKKIENINQKFQLGNELLKQKRYLEKILKLKEKILKLKELENSVKKILEEYKETLKKFILILKELKICPLCLSEINDFKRIIESKKL